MVGDYDDEKGSPIFIVLFWVVVVIGLVVCSLAILAGGYAG